MWYGSRLLREVYNTENLFLKIDTDLFFFSTLGYRAISERPQISQKYWVFNQLIIFIFLLSLPTVISFLMPNVFKSSIRDNMCK